MLDLTGLPTGLDKRLREKEDQITPGFFGLWNLEVPKKIEGGRSSRNPDFWIAYVYLRCQLN